MKFHPGHKTKTGSHEFAINDHGTAVQLSLAGGSSVVAITGGEALELRNWLNASEIRTDDEHAAILEQEKVNPTKEVNSGFKVELGDNKHVHVATLEEAETLKSAVAEKAKSASKPN